jgi:hypothetical protein
VLVDLLRCLGSARICLAGSGKHGLSICSITLLTIEAYPGLREVVHIDPGSSFLMEVITSEIHLIQVLYLLLKK